MNNLYRNYQKEKATICASNKCVTVFGDTARIVNGIAVVVAVLMAIALLDKAIR